jgi:hypothetical protein
VNITVFNISGAGSNGVFRAGTVSPPTTAWINYPPTETQRANAGVLPLGAGGTKRLKLAPIMDAIGALRAAHSVADGGSIMDFKQYYLAAKVKVEALPPSAEASLLAPVVDAYSDANTVLLAGKGSGVATFAPSEWRRLVSTYPGIHIGTVEVDWSNATIVKDLHEGGINLINEGFKRLKVAEERLAKPSSP